jgi:hypothetical protein
MQQHEWYALHVLVHRYKKDVPKDMYYTDVLVQSKYRCHHAMHGCSKGTEQNALGHTGVCLESQPSFMHLCTCKHLPCVEALNTIVGQANGLLAGTALLPLWSQWMPS